MINLQHICVTWWEFCPIVDLSSMIKEAGIDSNHRIGLTTIEIFFFFKSCFLFMQNCITLLVFIFHKSNTWYLLPFCSFSEKQIIIIFCKYWDSHEPICQGTGTVKISLLRKTFLYMSKTFGLLFSILLEAEKNFEHSGTSFIYSPLEMLIFVYWIIISLMWIAILQKIDVGMNQRKQ